MVLYLLYNKVDFIIDVLSVKKYYSAWVKQFFVKLLSMQIMGNKIPSFFKGKCKKWYLKFVGYPMVWDMADYKTPIFDF